MAVSFKVLVVLLRMHALDLVDANQSTEIELANQKSGSIII